ncbi:MAG: twin transmembrane helix small protein [Rhodobacterales bacterium]|jgi:ammonia channel protein AmtB|nr:twin transmembrane helix small protein [Pseudomonadota bacterium]MDA1286964.1 twin transmembrane helix small protein [Pseudomonadota bacterium]NQW12842.1 twin transmembrane helix small protein [Rhodobacter sp.]HBN29716.1 twin transmembrane helix small protein [Paracoccaceae bacterium]
MASDPLFYLVIAAVLIVLVILMFGIGTFSRGGEFNRKYANKIMRARIVAQAIAVLLIMLFVYLRSRGG